MSERKPDPYYQSARLVAGLKDRQDIADYLRAFHQSAIDEAVQVAIACIDKCVTDPEAASKAKDELCETYAASGFICDDRKALAATEAYLSVIVGNDPAKSLVLTSAVNRAKVNGDGVDITDSHSGYMEITPHPGKYHLK